MTIGYNWSSKAFKDTTWVTGSWRAISTFYASLLTRTHAIVFSDRLQKVE